MATVIKKRSVAPKEIKKFLGLNENQDGEYGLKLGEATTQLNYRITPQYQLKQREGYKKVADFGNGKDVQGLWHGTIGGKTVLLAVNDGKLYEFEEDEL